MGLLADAAFWSPLHAFLRHTAASVFIRSANLDLIANVEDLSRLLPTLRSYEVPYTAKWIGTDET